MTHTIKPIKTIYNGYPFRSRTEARWAVFFDALGVSYDYEIQGYELSDGTPYLPDFYLPELECWVEIKGTEPTDEERRKAYLLSAGKQETVLIVSGAPGYTENRCMSEFWEWADYDIEAYAGEPWAMWEMPVIAPETLGLRGQLDHMHPWLQGLFPDEVEDVEEYTDAPDTPERRRRYIELDRRYYRNKYGEAHPAYQLGRHTNHGLLWDIVDGDLTAAYLPERVSPDVLGALVTARGARFEHGETPNP